ncbi:FERM domain-containing protein 6 isoform X1 [Clarias gariepinus]|uniref:FERM domain-containing protein 6 isoform X1 n=1 Tax=Clarias gariepinus TaxID=13013 RepID=UPI00234C1B06|nr:FERM domain-containing protein 6 isoform X1 [Clarias gariepinus]XP_053368162.1 FERM domain-containing protein 6 isoform X1 [Clarias gariepinus]XP_053368163.1 FERM domain-containing protein 6 isoform X1 [Clarias gariepinus]XP_053368165.1 FERM domain-containing protein 6 isoform X1 [Clarias gariepinus]XP_053368166.1 FERM domain-containing protein 6 isoform X1 [Clarias gariepinus]XP_053368167.1 FERM domain-containing protein 6 isoform X1 [Clarias gariepinus]XP_053368168.1 FERM domain-containi
MLKKGETMPNSANQKTTLCEVVLPNKSRIQITVEVKCRTQEMMKQLSEQLGIKNLHIFGLSLQKGPVDKDYLFLDPEKKLTTYFPKTRKQNMDRMVLHLRAQYYVRDGQQIVDEEVRNLYCADLKNRVLSSRCYGQEGLYFQLAAYALQAELGDWKEETYFTPQDYFPPWILKKRGFNYVVQHTPALHRELKGISAHDASLLFIEEACSLSDVPLTFYSICKGKKEKRASMLLGLALTGLHIYDIETASGEYQLLYEFAWSGIDRLKFQGRRFEIRADSLAGEILVMYTRSVMQSQHLLKHMSNNHHVNLLNQHSFKQQQRKGRRKQREVYIRDNIDPDWEESDDELPSIMTYLDNTRQHHADTMATFSVANAGDTAWGFSRKALGEIELCVDEPEEMYVDDPEEIIQLTERLQGVSVGGPPLVNVSQWTDFSMEMKQVLRARWRACSHTKDQCGESMENLTVTH